MNLNQWAIKHHVSFEALHELQIMLGMVNTDPEPKDHDAKSEAAVQADVRLEASKKGLRLFRNNVGVAPDENGVRCLRYGLANDSERMNNVVKSSDLIGIRKVLITREMVGQTIGQFVARECKPELWAYSGTKREEAQLAFLNLILSYGGDAAFATSEGTL